MGFIFCQKMITCSYKQKIMYIFSWNYIKEKWAHVGFQKYFQNAGWAFTSRILCMLVSFITTVFIARRLGPGNFGQLSYAVSFVGLFSILATFGIDNILYRELINNPERKREFLGSAFVIKIIAGFVTTVLVIISSFIWAQDDVSKILILILSGTFIFNAFQIINYEFQARIKSKYPSIIAFVITVILNTLKIIIIVNGKGVIYLAFVLLLESILYAIFYWIAYEKKIEKNIFNWKFDKNIAITLLKDSWPLIFTSAFALIYSRIDQVLIKYMTDAKSVGIYSSAVTIAEVWYFIPTIIVLSLFPAIINAKKTSEEMYRSRIKKLSLLLLGLSIVVAIVTNIFAPIIIKIIYGNAFMGSVIILKIYVWAGVGTFVGMLVTNYLIAENKKGILALVNFIPMIINVILNLMLIPKYGIIGSAYATLISYILGPISVLLFKEPRKIFLK